jgi:FtsH-binding integral membrane protein
MDNRSFVSPIQDNSVVQAQQKFMSKVYGWMVGGMLVTALTAYFISSSEELLMMVLPYMIILILAELGLVIFLSARIEKMSKNTAIISFLAYSFLNGLTMSVILLSYTVESISTTFFVAATMFGGLSLYGFVTKKSLSGLGSFMFMGLIGIIVASLLNMFIASSALHFAISILGVIIFAGLTAYDTQKLKQMYEVQYGDEATAAKTSIMGALILYLDFINLFLFLLRIFGSRR